MLKLLFILSLFIQDIPMAKLISKTVTKVAPDPKKPKEVKPVAKAKAPKPDAWSDSAYVARNYKEVSAKDSSKTIAAKKVVAKKKNDKTGKSVLTPTTNHY